ncbi:6908_t:CDS:2 [Funneliformis geosporum]|uniref:6908_t:CDS:1 n=1 Tax=Funneliformis geosporum TaxID=1117311 RepID=A0A9W4SMA4_9GLOM|nr:6908_t:CDS:2 [Funneliformis geosporum]
MDGRSTRNLDIDAELNNSQNISEEYYNQECKNTNENLRLLPYIAPEISKGLTPTIASDIYSLGRIMLVLPAGFRPRVIWIHEHNTATKICLRFSSRNY